MKGKTNGVRNVVYDLSRINEWWLLSVGLVLFAYVPNQFAKSGDEFSQEFFEAILGQPPIYLALLIVFSAQVFLFASNDYFDRNVDALDPKKKARNPVSNGTVTLPGVRAMLIVTGIIPLAVSVYFGVIAFAFVAVSLLAFYFYTAPPLRLKNKPVLDVLSHGIFVNTFPYFFCLVVLQDFTVGSVFLLTAIMMRSAMAQLLQEIRDYNIDRQVEKNTVVVLGQKRAIWLVFSIYLALFIASATLLLTYEFFGWGLPLYYIIILILCFSFIPIFRKLLAAREYGSEIEKLWMGQGRTNRWMIAQYFASFSVYFIIMVFLLT